MLKEPLSVKIRHQQIYYTYFYMQSQIDPKHFNKKFSFLILAVEMQ